MKTADEIIALNDRPDFPVEIPQWGIVAKVQELDAEMMATLSKSCTDENGVLDEVALAARVIVEGCLEPKFEIRHIEALRKKSNTAVTRLYRAIVRGKKNEDLKNSPKSSESPTS